MIVALYPRVSSSKQAKEGDSIEAQENRLKRFCKERGYQIYKVYTDSGKSANINDESLNQVLNKNLFVNSYNLNKRPAFNELLNDAKKKLFEAIIFFKWDRYARDIAFSELSIRYFNKFGIRLIPSDDTEDLFASSIVRSVSKYETDKNKARIRLVRLERFEKGIFSARSPFGYKPIVKNKKVIGFEPNKESNIVKGIFEMAIKRIDYKVICKEFKIRPQQYYNIIRNPVYAGFIQFEKNIKKGIHIPLIEVNDFLKLNPNFKIPNDILPSLKALGISQTNDDN